MNWLFGVLLCGVGVGSSASQDLVSRTLGGAHWYGCKPAARSRMEAAFLRLAKVDFVSLRKACRAYVRAGYAIDEARYSDRYVEVVGCLRQLDVAIVARAKYFGALPSSKGEYFGPGSVFMDTCGWKTVGGKLRLELSRMPLLIEPDYNGLGELDYLHKLSSKPIP